jgi:hypothetical protein
MKFLLALTPALSPQERGIAGQILCDFDDADD